MLKAESISFSYGKAPLFKDYSFEVNAGERVALCAPSGFGKTTLCKILAGYLQPDKGKVTLDDSPVPAKGICPVQMVWQHPERAVDPRMRMKKTLLEAGPLDERLMNVAGIRGEWLSRFPHELSGGELQRFCIVRALSANPRFIIADEMSTMLDALTQVQLWKLLVAEVEKRGAGLVFVSHSEALTQHIATRIELLDQLSY